MKLLSTKLSQFSALVLLGSMLSVPLTVFADNYEFDEGESEQEYESDDSTYGNQTDLQKMSQPMYNEPEDDDEDSMDWENDDDGREEDDSIVDDDEDMIEN